MLRRLPPRALGLILGVGADALLGDPRRFHPVAGFGRWAGVVEGVSWRDARMAGVGHVVLTVTPVLVGGALAERMGRRDPAAHVMLTAVTTWAVLGGRSLSREGRAMAEELERDDVCAARRRLPSLCGRDPSVLDSAELARGALESLAENANDAVVAPLWWGAVAGVPGLVVHRAVNTLDAMVGHRSPRYARFGTASARLDDAFAWLPARVTGVLACALAPVVGGSPSRAWRIMLRDRASHPSPNGGWCEAAWAGVLGVRLGGRNVYAGRVEVRPHLGHGPAPGPGELRDAARLLDAVTVVAAICAVLLALVVDGARRGR